jgi:two-component system chemotaxis response regulator CheB
MTTTGTTTGKVIAVGASGGQGLTDLFELLGSASRATPASILVVLHRPFDAESALRAVLQRQSNIPVSVVNGPQRLRPGHCYIGHPARHLVMTGPGELGLVEDGAGAHRNATVNLLFSSVARHAGRAATGIVLSGCLSDGSLGMLAIKAAGGTTMARGPCHTFLSDMARNAMRTAGPLDHVSTPQGLAAYLG